MRTLVDVMLSGMDGHLAAFFFYFFFMCACWLFFFFSSFFGVEMELATRKLSLDRKCEGRFCAYHFVCKTILVLWEHKVGYFYKTCLLVCCF